ncbi:MAG TPA: AAA family ATPase [Burkholderiales bacterium]|nr:AAA family ATPase [Burkholderiales bacterium]
MNRDPLDVAIAGRLNVVLVSHSAETARAFTSRFAEGGQAPHRVFEGSVEQARMIAQRERPELLVVEGSRHDESELLALEPLMLKEPGMSVIFLSNNQSAAFLRLGMRIGLRDILPLPLSMDVLLASIGRHQERASASARSVASKVHCFMGCKGGSGATFLATNLGYALAGQGKRVALLDLNTPFGDAAVYITDRTPRFTLADVAKAVDRLDGTLLDSSMVKVLPNFHVLAAPEDADQALKVRAEDIEALLAIASTHYDVILVDGCRSLNALIVRAMDRADSVFVILQQSVPYLRDAQRLVHALEGLGYGRDKIRLIINRFDKKALIDEARIARSLKHDAHAVIPNSFSAVADSIDQGVPLAKLASRDPVARRLEQMAAEMAGARKDGGGWLRTLLVR